MDAGCYQGSVKVVACDSQRSADLYKQAATTRRPTLLWWRLQLGLSLRLLQINLHYSKAASAALSLRLAKGKADVVLVQEPWVVGGKVAGLGTREYKLMLDPKEGKIRTCILAKRHLNIFLLRNYSNGDNTSVSLELQHGSIRLLSVYMAFEKEDPPDALVRGLAKECEELKTGLVIGCDANAHHTQWGCPNNNDRGESLFDFFLNSNLFLCNRGNVPTFITKACQTIIDLTLDLLVSAVTNWFVSDEHSFSDHRYIETDIEKLM
ncbi:uncharacterized protein, partial [Drosophila takahashii]|uniref:uncharacterized protein n=1 Tax=Drosophila takahashii TaxID=29030 RepID=UPI0038995CD7